MVRVEWVGFLLGLALSACAERPSPRVAAPAQLANGELATTLPPVPEPPRGAGLGALVPKLDDYFEKKMNESGATGLAVALLADGVVVYERAFGVRDVESKAPIDGNTVFRIGSLTKSFTALSVLKLRDEGKLSLDAPAATYVPELARIALPTRDAPPITARLLMTHASGLAYDDIWGAVTFGKDDRELAKLFESGVSFGSVPGTKYAYSNLGYALLGRIVERVSGADFRDYVTSQILRPLGMTSTVWEARDVGAGALAAGYHRDGDRLVRDVTPSDGVFDAAGGLYASFRDYVRYAAYHLKAYPPRDDAELGPVRRSTLREMHAGQRQTRGPGDKEGPVVRRTSDGFSLSAMSAGFGWHAVTSCTEERVTHGGFEPGYFANAILIPKSRFAFVALATSGPAGGMAWSGAFKILREAGVITPPAPAAPDPALVAAKGAVTALVARWDDAEANRTFDPQSRAYAWNANLREDFAKLGRDHGACRPDGKLTTFGPLNGRFRLACERGAVEIDVLLSPENPPRVQNAEWRQELVPDERTKKAAGRVAALVGAWNDAAAADVFAPHVDRLKIKKTFAHLALDHGGCALESGVFEVSRAPMLKDPGKAVFRMKCGSAPFVLAFGLDEKSGKVAHLSADPRNEPTAACFE